ncbi:MAG TPA: hypothetical protein VM573_04940 [Actinomycetota bacterium]|nr:hypothetical protein [Actinomycetota bacterium]
MSGKFAADPQQRRTLARVAVVFAGFIVFRLVGDDRAIAGFLLWSGIVVAGFPLADRLTRVRTRGGETLGVGAICLGIGLTIAGAFLALR